MAGLYIHIPFCKRKCVYCDFYSVAFSPVMMERYVSLLLKEFDRRKGEVANEKFRTIYFGGGTPSLLPVNLLKKLICHVGLDDAEEITIEVNPDDVTEEFAREIVAAGINRVSMGIQSFDDKELKFLNRRHDSSVAKKAVGILKSSGICNISIDLIYGIPGQTLATWRKSLEDAIALGVPHISAYNLTYEEGTKLTVMRDEGKIEEAGEDLCVEMFDVLAAMLSDAGYEHYEISNFALPGMHSRHNSSYWNFTPYIGLGASAHSFDGRVRRYNPSDLRRYMELVEKNGMACDEEHETVGQLYNEWVMTRLRTRHGLDLNDLLARFGRDRLEMASEVLDGYKEKGFVTVANGVACLTRKGIMVSDMIFRDLFVV